MPSPLTGGEGIGNGEYGLEPYMRCARHAIRQLAD